jgi:rhodanese-related sulfurtransferase
MRDYFKLNLNIDNSIIQLHIFTMKFLFIDIRKSDEVYSKHFDQSQEYSFYNIPMNMIRFNAQTIIKHLDYYDEIYIVCQTANRSQFIKNKYFNNHANIKVSENLQFSNLKHGSNLVSLHKKNDMKINIVGSNSFNFYNVMRIIQTVMGIVMLSIGMYIYIRLNKEKMLNKIILPLIILVAFGSMALYNGLTSTCSLSILLEDYLN